MTRLVVVGQGYVGLPLAMRAVQAGHDVTGLDTSIDRVKRLSAGDSFVEDVPDTELLAALASGRYRVTDSPSACDGFDVAVVAVPTPLRDSAPDLGYVEQAARTLAPFVTRDCLVVLESTTYPGTTEAVVVPLLEAGSGLTAGWDFAVGYSPERIDPGNAEWTLTTTPKIVSGIDPASLARTEKFYGALVERTVPVSSTRSAELAKLLENTFRHVNIALVNELAMVAADLGVDVWEAIDAASTKPFGFMRFTPGPGVGGHCLPIDPSYLSWTVRQRLGRSFRFVELANDVNDHMPAYVVRRIAAHLNGRSLSVRGRRILLLGLAYKRNTGDARESPSRPIARQLVTLGADVRVADPHTDDDQTPAGTVRVEASPAEAAAADLVVLLVDHDAFALDDLAASASHVLDCRRRITGDHVEAL